jgi:SagB-type dehydrogenase family enzyme
VTIPALEYHALTAHRPHVEWADDPRLVKGFQPLRFDVKPPQFKTYPGAEAIALPDDLAAAKPERWDAAGIGRLLFLSGGVVRYLDTPHGPLWFRAAGSAGNLSPLELYVVTGDLPGVEAGVYHYEPVEHGLVRLRGAPADTPPALVITGVPWRTTWKYRERGFRHLWWDAGTMLAQTLLVAGMDVSLELGFVDADVAALVGAEMPHELPLAVVGLTGPASLPEPEPVPAGHLADEPFEFPLVTAAFRAGELGAAGEVEAWRAAAAAFDDWEPPGSSWFTFPSLDASIRKRGSSRQFDPSRPGSRELLESGLGWAAGEVPGVDFVAPGASLLEHFVIAHATEGMAPGAYRFAFEGPESIRPGDLRANARHLTLDQSIGGDGAYTVFHVAHLDEVVSKLGDRGYRAALLEAGVVEGRLHLAAYALGYGATGLTFYDEEVSRFFSTDAAAMLVTAVGTPPYRSRPGGTPRRPVRLVPQ